VQPNGARDRALLIGTAWTLAAAAVAAWFKSARAEPIYLWTMGVVALGWAGVLLYALAAERRAAGACVAPACDSRGVIDALAMAAGVEMQRACGELLRVDELLGHAIEQLMSAFDGLSGQMRCHYAQVVPAQAAAQPDADGLRAAAERVASELNAAVTALQFRDVVGQKLGHVRCELEALVQVMQRVRELSADRSGAAGAAGHTGAPGRAGLAARVCGLLQELEQARAASPVKQESMHAGEVDLF
jgi:hypothetical protein